MDMCKSDCHERFKTISCIEVNPIKIRKYKCELDVLLPELFHE